MNILGFQKARHYNSFDPEKPDLPINPNGGDGKKDKAKMSKSKPFSTKEFVDKVNEFLEAAKNKPETNTLEKAHLVDLFRFWWMDFRELEAVEEAREEGRTFGLGDMLD